VPNRRPQLRIVTSASPEEAAAVVAAVERFLRDHAPPTDAARATASPWTRAARLEAVHAEAPRVGPAPWGEPHRWGSSRL
jgi:hypothetical protein